MLCIVVIRFYKRNYEELRALCRQGQWRKQSLLGGRALRSPLTEPLYDFDYGSNRYRASPENLWLWEESLEAVGASLVELRESPNLIQSLKITGIPLEMMHY